MFAVFQVSFAIYIGIIDFELDSASELYLSYYNSATPAGSIGVSLTLNLYRIITINFWKVSYLCYDFSLMTFLTSASSSSTYTVATGPNMTTGSGYRTISSSITFSTGAINLTHSVYIMPFLCAVDMYRSSASDNFAVGITL
jgi:hypothetical protein